MGKPIAKPLRKYQESWNLLKRKGVIIVEVTNSKNPAVIKKYASTYIRGVQKEKYNDTEFRRKFNYARIESIVDFAKGQIRVLLILNNFNSPLEDL